MFQKIVTRFSVLAAAAGLMLACTGERASPVAPDEQPAFKTERAKGVAKALTRKHPLREDVSVTVMIGEEGGSFEVRKAGLRVAVPPGAVTTPTVFTATALAGNLIAYDFGPHGSWFNVPLRVTQDLEATNWKLGRESLADVGEIEAAYFQDVGQLDRLLGAARVDEFLPVEIDAGRSSLDFSVEHFSGYMVSSGRT